MPKVKVRKNLFPQENLKPCVSIEIFTYPTERAPTRAWSLGFIHGRLISERQ